MGVSVVFNDSDYASILFYFGVFLYGKYHSKHDIRHNKFCGSLSDVQKKPVLRHRIRRQ